MRWLLRLLIFWAITAPISYYFGLPKLIAHLTTKTQTAAYEQCVEHLRSQNMLGTGGMPPERGDTYCHCISDKLVFTKADILDMALQKPPATLTALSQTVTTQCNADLTRDMNAAAARAHEDQQFQEQLRLQQQQQQMQPSPTQPR